MGEGERLLLLEVNMIGGYAAQCNDMLIVSMRQLAYQQISAQRTHTHIKLAYQQISAQRTHTHTHTHTHKHTHLTQTHIHTHTIQQQSKRFW